MNQATAFHQRPLLLSRRGLLASMAGTAVVLLAACSGTGAAPGTETGTPAASTVAGTSSPQATTSQSTTAAPGTPPAATALAINFPSAVLPLMPGSTLQVSGMEQTDPFFTASLTATVVAAPAAVLDFYTESFSDQGFKAQPGDAVDGTPLKTFVRANGQEIATISVVQSANTSTYTLGATLLPDSIK